MNKVYLNGEFVDASEAKISPMDRGFLFGDGIYEVIPTYLGKPVGLHLHLERMKNGLHDVGINYEINADVWADIIRELISQQQSKSQGVYVHVSRGTDVKRFHAYPKNVAPTVFAYAFDTPPSQDATSEKVKGYHVTTGLDLRWQRCHIKSTSLLGNVMHFQQGQDAGVDEIILYNENKEITEAAACNVFMVKNDIILTPPLNNHLLPGITRRIAIDAIKHYTDYEMREETMSLDALLNADEVWITSSSKEIGPVLSIDGNAVGYGKAGPIWIDAQNAYNKHKFNC
ncbi:MAG: D-alanine transaminase [Glaciecola sp.]|jgi:D-alanine transaminase